MEDGSVVRLRLNQAGVAKALGAVLEPDVPPDGLFIDLYTGLMSPPRVGENLIGKLDFNDLLAGMAANDQIIVVIADGLYSFKGTGYIRSGLFDRIQLVQGSSTIRLSKDRYRNVERFRIPGAPEFYLRTMLGRWGADRSAPFTDAALAEYDDSEGLLVFENALDRLLVSKWLAIAEETANPALKTYLGLKVDGLNLNNIIRCKIEDVSIEPYLLEGGLIGRRVVDALIEADVDDIPRIVEGTQYHKPAKRILEEYVRTGDLSMLEGELNKLTHGIFRLDVIMNPLSLGSIMCFIHQKEWEVRRLSSLMVAKSHGIPPEEIKKMVA